MTSYSKFGSRQLVAVITGDFIGFSDQETSVRRRMHQVMGRCGRDLQSACAGLMNHDISVFRGDSWQALVEKPQLVLRAALFIKACVRAEYGDYKMDTRIAIGIGTVDYVPADHVAAGDGAAFRSSGRLLESMAHPNEGRMRFSFPDLREEKLIDGLVRLTGTLCDSWSSRQALAVLGALKYRTQADIAEHWPKAISRQAVGRHLSRAGWPAISHGLGVFENYMANLL